MFSKDSVISPVFCCFFSASICAIFVGSLCSMSFNRFFTKNAFHCSSLLVCDMLNQSPNFSSSCSAHSLPQQLSTSMVSSPLSRIGRRNLAGVWACWRGVAASYGLYHRVFSQGCQCPRPWCAPLQPRPSIGVIRFIPKVSNHMVAL